MIRRLKRFVKTALACIVVVACIVLFLMGPAMQKTIESIGPEIIGAPVTMEKLRIYPLTGTIRLTGLVIGNPDGFATDHVLSLTHLKIHVAMTSLRSDTIIVKEILFDAPEFTYEKRMNTDNITVIRDNIKDYANRWETTKAEPKPATPTQGKPEKGGKKVIIERLLLRDGWVKAKVPYLPTAPVPLPDIEKSDIGKKTGGTTWSAAAEEIISILDDAILEVVASLGSAAGGIIKETGKALGEAAGGVVKGIGNLFK